MALDLVIDADTHLTEPPDVWTSRVPARYVEHVPRMVRNDAGRDVWVVDDQHLSTVGNTAVAGWPRPFPDAPPTLQDCPLAAYDAVARAQIVATAQRPPDRQLDGTGTWSLSTLPRSLRRATLPVVGATTIRRVLQDAGSSYQQTRTWCPTGTAQRKRKAGVVTVTDPQTEAKRG